MNDIDDAIAATLSDILIALDIDLTGLNTNYYKWTAFAVIDAMKTRLAELEAKEAEREEDVD